MQREDSLITLWRLEWNHQLQGHKTREQPSSTEKERKTERQKRK